MSSAYLTGAWARLDLYVYQSPLTFFWANPITPYMHALQHASSEDSEPTTPPSCSGPSCVRGTRFLPWLQYNARLSECYTWFLSGDVNSLPQTWSVACWHCFSLAVSLLVRCCSCTLYPYMSGLLFLSFPKAPIYEVVDLVFCFYFYWHCYCYVTCIQLWAVDWRVYRFFSMVLMVFNHCRCAFDLIIAFQMLQ